MTTRRDVLIGSAAVLAASAMPAEAIVYPAPGEFSWYSFTVPRSAWQARTTLAYFLEGNLVVGVGAYSRSRDAEFSTWKHLILREDHTVPLEFMLNSMSRFPVSLCSPPEAGQVPFYTSMMLRFPEPLLPREMAQDMRAMGIPSWRFKPARPRDVLI